MVIFYLEMQVIESATNNHTRGWLSDLAKISSTEVDGIIMIQSSRRYMTIKLGKEINQKSWK